MPSHRQYSQAPLLEAVIDIRIQPNEGFDLDSVMNLLDRMQFPDRQEHQLNEFAFPLAPGEQPTRQSRVTGFMFTSEDRATTVIAEREGFVYSRRPPYKGWETFSTEARVLWEDYCSHTQPVAVTRIGLRSINKFRFEGRPVPLQEFLTIMPTVKDTLGLFGPSFMQVQILQTDLAAMLVVNQQITPLADGIDVILDFDLSNQQSRSVSDQEGVWGLVSSLHQRLYESFEACLTDRTREIIK